MKKARGSYTLTGADWGLMILIILIYSLISFVNLGSYENPQTFWNRDVDGNRAIIKLERKTEVSKIRYFSGARVGNYKIYISDDDINYEYIGELEMDKVFAWFDAPIDKSFTYLTLVAEDEEELLGEIALYDVQGEKVTLLASNKNANFLIDEGNSVPHQINYLNSTYFDEVYHARTAYEYVEGLDIYEWTHPPLGKLIMSIPIRYLGMTPFAYRLMGNVAGILMLAVIYIFGKRLFKETRYAALASFLLAIDGMHFVQTRIGTVDSFLVLFILLSYLFMYQYILCCNRGGLWKKLINLLASGIFMGAAIATKWNGAYGAIGLALLFFIDLYRRNSNNWDHKWKDERRKIIIWCFVFFLFIPIGIYIATYIPFLMIQVESPLIKLWELQVRMFNYHSGLTDTHAYGSPWYLWPLAIKPIWYYKGNIEGNGVSSIVLHGNPFIWWTGIIGIFYAFKEALIEREKSYICLSVAILAVYIPNIFISRVMFLYHYFPVIPFMVLSIVGLLQALESGGRYKKLLKWYIIIAVGMFVFFFPVYSGIVMPNWYAYITEWLPVWSFY